MLFQTLLIYTSFIVVLYFSGLNIEKKRRALAVTDTPFTYKALFRSSFFMFLYFAVLVGLRYDVGTDHLHYWVAYELEGNERFEFLFQLLSDICNRIGFHPTVFFGILGLIQIVFLYLAFKDESYLFAFFAIFLFTDGIFASWMNTIRQDIACCIWIFALNYIIQKKPVPYLLLCLIAFLFHRSAIILVVIYPIFRGGKDFFHRIPVQLIIVFFAFILKNSIGELLLKMDSLFSWYSNIVFLGGDSDLYSSYSAESAVEGIGQNMGEVQNTGIGVIVKYLSYTIIVLYSNRIKEYFNSPKVNTIYTLFYISFIAYIILPFGVWSLARPFQNLNCTRMIMLSYLVYYLFKNKQGNSVILAYLIIFLQIGMYFSSMIVASQSVLYHGYQLFFQVA